MELEVIKNIVQWGLDRNIIQSSSLEAQFLKLEEELNELRDALKDGDNAGIADAIGDMGVVLIMMSEIFGKKVDAEDYEDGFPTDEHTSYFQECLHLAYDEIKDRKGKLIDGVFVKEE